MIISNIAQYTFRTIYLSLAMGFVSFSSAADTYTQMTPEYSVPNLQNALSHKEKGKTNEQRVGSFLYKAIHDPDKVRNQVAGTAILYGLDNVGLGDTVREGVDFIKKNTRYAFGDCGHVKFKTSRITADSCLSESSSVELNSSYNFNAVQLQFRWSL